MTYGRLSSMKMRHSYLIKRFQIILTALCIVCASTHSRALTSVIEISEHPWGIYNSQVITRYTLSNSNGMQVSMTNWGAYVTSIMVPDKHGHIEDVILGYDTAQEYINDCCFNGASVGRVANRIAGGSFEINGEQVKLSTKQRGANKGHHLHGGEIGFNKKVWTARQISDGIEMQYLSPHGEEGYPGNLNIKAIFTLNNNDEFSIRYTATSDRITPINIVSHMYFNLTGNQKRSIEEHRMRIFADKIVQVSDGLLPTGKLISVIDSPFNFLTERGLKVGLETKNAQLEFAGGVDKTYGGYDHTWVFNEYDKRLRKQASLHEPQSGRVLQILTTQPGLHVYSGNFMNGSVVGKDNKPMKHRHGIALETQHFPDSVNHTNFPSTLLYPGAIYNESTVYRFTTYE